MTFRGAVLKFRLGEGEALKRLVTERGYSKPPSKDEIVLKRLTDYGSIEVHKKDDETVMVLLKPTPDGEQFIIAVVAAAVADLEAVGLFIDIPF